MVGSDTYCQEEEVELKNEVGGGAADCRLQTAGGGGDVTFLPLSLLLLGILLLIILYITLANYYTLEVPVPW
jgi:hypothetical protein